MYMYFSHVHVDDISKSRLMSLWKSVRSPSPATDETNPDSVPSNEDEGFNSEPFVRAAVLYRESRFSDILEVLTEAVESGTHTVGGAEWDLTYYHTDLYLENIICLLWINLL